MLESPAILQQFLTHHHLSPQQFATISGMPLTEVRGLLDGNLDITIMRAHHLAAVFETSPELWLRHYSAAP